MLLRHIGSFILTRNCKLKELAIIMRRPHLSIFIFFILDGTKVQCKDAELNTAVFFYLQDLSRDMKKVE